MRPDILHSRRTAIGAATAAIVLAMAPKRGWARTDGSGLSNKRDWKQDMIEDGTIERPQARYAFRAIGKGPPVVFLHGLFASPRLFDPQMLALAGQFRCISIALPPHAGSQILSDSLTIDDIAQDIADIAAGFEGEPAILIGNSMGGAVALRAALRRPDAIGKMVIIASHGGSLDPAFGNGIRQWSQADPVARRQAIAQIIAHMYPAAWIEANKPEFERQVDEAAAISAEQLDGLGRTLLSYEDVSARLIDLAAPVLLLWGDRDAIADIGIAAGVASGFRFARLEVIAGAGHQPQVDKPAAVTEALVRFLSP